MNVVVDQELTKEKIAIMEEFVSLSKLDEKIERLTTSAVHNIENNRSSIPESIFDQYKKIIVEVFDSSLLKEQIRFLISEHPDFQQCSAMIDFLKNPQIISMVEKEENTKSQKAQQDMRQFFTDQSKANPSEIRKRLIEQVDKVKCFSVSVINSQVEMFYAVTWGLQGLNENGKKITQSQFEQMLVSMKENIEPTIKNQIWMSLLYAYHNLSDIEIEDYIAMFTNSAGRLTTEFSLSVFSGMHKQTVQKMQSMLDSEFS